MQIWERVVCVKINPDYEKHRAARVFTVKNHLSQGMSFAAINIFRKSLGFYLVFMILLHG